jgi:S1-C subfamily serine protease
MPVPRPGEIQVAAILSLDVFANQDLYLDGPGKKAVFLPAVKPTAVFYNRLGASFTSPAFTAKVAAGGPAARAGVDDGDILLKIDGLSPGDYAAKITAPSVWTQPAGTSVVLTLKRGAQQLERRVVLEDWLGQSQ